MTGRYWCLAALLAGLFVPKMVFATPASICDATSGNLVQNCGFETGDFTSWTMPPTGNLDGNTIVVGPDGGDNSGHFFAALGAVGSDNVMYQDLSTVAGLHYLFSFYLASDGGTPNDFTALWDGNVVFSQADIPSQDYTLELFDVVATQTTTRIEFDSQNTPGYLRLDDVTVIAPEPNLAFLSSFLLGLALLGFRKIRRAA